LRNASVIFLTLALWLAPAAARAQTDEIQVYDGGLAPVGTFNLTWHNNFIPKGQSTPPFEGAVVADHSFNGVKLRALFAVPNADDRRFFYGANFEFSVNAHRWDSTHFTSEVRPIVGWHLKPWDIIINPIVDTAYDGLKNLEFVPASRVAYNFASGWTLAAEEYDDFGPLHAFLPASEQAHQLYAVVDRTWKDWDFEGGVGVGMTDASDRLTLKLIVSRDLNKRGGASKK